jgi:hypothetical protein
MNLNTLSHGLIPEDHNQFPFSQNHNKNLFSNMMTSMDTYSSSTEMKNLHQRNDSNNIVDKPIPEIKSKQNKDFTSGGNSQ